MKHGINVPLEVTPPLYFLIYYHH